MNGNELQGVEIVVGTPARVCDLVESGGIPIESIRFVILDEADQVRRRNEGKEKMIDTIIDYITTIS